MLSPFLKGFSNASRKVREDFAFAYGQADKALQVRVLHFGSHLALADLDELFLRLPFSTQTASFYVRAQLYASFPIRSMRGGSRFG